MQFYTVGMSRRHLMWQHGPKHYRSVKSANKLPAKFPLLSMGPESPVFVGGCGIRVSFFHAPMQCGRCAVGDEWPATGQRAGSRTWMPHLEITELLRLRSHSPGQTRAILSYTEKFVLFASGFPGLPNMHGLVHVQDQKCFLGARYTFPMVLSGAVLRGVLLPSTFLLTDPRWSGSWSQCAWT